MEKMHVNIEGMHCGACATGIQMLVSGMDGVGTVFVDYDKKTGPVSRLVKQVDSELKKVENGGPGLPGETIIKSEPERKEQSLDTTVPGDGDGAIRPDAAPEPMDEVPEEIPGGDDINEIPPVIDQGSAPPPVAPDSGP